MKLSHFFVAITLIVIAPYIMFKLFLSKPIYQTELDLGKIEKEIINTQVAYEKQEDITQLDPTVCPANQLTQETIKRIVIHHTVVSNDDVNIVYEAISRSHQKRWERWQTLYPNMPSDMMDKVATPSGKYTMYHRLIWLDGKIAGDRLDTQVWRWGWRKDNCNNIWAYHIALVWNFQNSVPTAKQYEALNQIIKWLRDKYWDLPIYGHWQLEWEATACPGKLFNYAKIDEYKKPVRQYKVITKDYTAKVNWQLAFNITRYYSPEQWQRHYYNNKTYEQDVTMNCGASAIGNDGCLYPANGMHLIHELKWKLVACPPQFKLWTRFKLEWIGIVECVDRWSAIQMQWNTIRLDMRCGIWQRALDEWSSCPTGKNIIGKIIE